MDLLVPLSVSVQDISDNGRDQAGMLRGEGLSSVVSRMPTPKFLKGSMKASVPESYMNELSSSMGKNRELPDDNVLSSPYKLLLSPVGNTESKIDLHNLPTDLNTIEAITEFQPIKSHEAIPKIVITDHETLP
jgi:hypothetical protein